MKIGQSQWDRWKRVAEIRQVSLILVSDCLSEVSSDTQSSQQSLAAVVCAREQHHDQHIRALIISFVGNVACIVLLFLTARDLGVWASARRERRASFFVVLYQFSCFNCRGSAQNLGELRLRMLCITHNCEEVKEGSKEERKEARDGSRKEGGN